MYGLIWTEPGALVMCLLPYHVESTISRPITEVKQHWMGDRLGIRNAVDILLSSHLLCWQTLRISSLLRVGHKTKQNYILATNLQS